MTWVLASDWPSLEGVPGLDDPGAGCVDVELLELAPELVQVDPAAGRDTAGQAGPGDCPLDAEDTFLSSRNTFLRRADVGKSFLKTHGGVVAATSRRFGVQRATERCYCKPQAGRGASAHAQWVLAG